MAPRSAREPARTAENTPSGTPVPMAISSAAPARMRVAFRRPQTSGSTPAFSWMLRPQSPDSTPFSQFQYCTGTGSFRPSCSRSAASEVAVAFGPRIIWAGSPGVRCSDRNTSTLTPNRVGTVTRSLLSRYAATIRSAAPSARHGLRGGYPHGFEAEHARRMRDETFDAGVHDDYLGFVVDGQDRQARHDEALSFLVQREAHVGVRVLAGLAQHFIDLFVRVVAEVEAVRGELVAGEEDVEEVVGVAVVAHPRHFKHLGHLVGLVERHDDAVQVS